MFLICAKVIYNQPFYVIVFWINFWGSSKFILITLSMLIFSNFWIKTVYFLVILFILNLFLIKV